MLKAMIFQKTIRLFDIVTVPKSAASLHRKYSVDSNKGSLNIHLKNLPLLLAHNDR